MFSDIALSIPIYLADSILSGLYGTDLLKTRLTLKKTRILWVILYFLMDVLFFEVLGFDGSISGIVVNFVGIFALQIMLFKWNYMKQIFVSLSFIAGKNIIKFVISTLYGIFSRFTLKIVEKMITSDINITAERAGFIMNTQLAILGVMCALVYMFLFQIYLRKVAKTVFYNGYEPDIKEHLFLIFPCVTAICISVTLRMLILRIDNGNVTLVYDSVPDAQYWVVLICFLLLGSIILTMTLFRYLVEYNEENRKQVILEKQMEQLHREIEDIDEIYSDLRSLKHDMRNHLNNIIHYINQKEDVDTNEIDSYISQIEASVDRLDISSNSGNPITDIIIYQRQQEAKKHHISFNVDFVYPKELAVDVYDVAVILNNALDNAFDAVGKLSEESEISLRSYMKGTLYFIEVKNKYAGKIVLGKETGLPVTRKGNKSFHGFGLENIRKCAQKYMGDIDIELYSDEGRKFFLLTVMLCSRISLQK